MAAITKDKEEPLHLKQGSKVFSQRLTRENSAAAPSFRVYYGVAAAGSVPFVWESQPGTPKNTISTAALPPLTPPPSYYVAGAAKDTTPAGGGGGKKSKHGILGSILHKIVLTRRARRTPSGSPTSFSSASSLSSSSSLASFLSTQSSACSSMRERESSRSSRHPSFSDEEETMVTTCFRVRHESFRALKGCRVAMTVRSALASVGGHGPSAAAQRV